jgi:hypothetical protein
VDSTADNKHLAGYWTRQQQEQQQPPPCVGAADYQIDSILLYHDKKKGEFRFAHSSTRCSLFFFFFSLLLQHLTYSLTHPPGRPDPHNYPIAVL